jgi:hypothetical protein
MNTITMPQVTFANSRLVQFFQSAFVGSKLLTYNGYAMLAAFAICSVLQFVDAREFNGINIWIKPGKFYLSMAVHFLTVAWALSFANQNLRSSRSVKWSAWVMIFCAWAEHAYITFRAANVDASHYNVGTQLNAALYNAMAFFAILLVLAPAVVGMKMWRANLQNIWTQSFALGFGLTAILTIIVGMTLGGNSSHWIGGDLTDATGLPIFKWSTTGGDLRVSHFISMHAAQFIPFAALSGKRSVVWGTAIVVIVLTALTYLQALSGVPLLRV